MQITGSINTIAQYNNNFAPSGDKVNAAFSNNNSNQNSVANNKLGKQQNSKQSSLLSSLMEKKSEIIQNRTNYVATSLEKGKTRDEMKLQLEIYDEQLKTVNEQISLATAEESKKIAENKDIKAEEKIPETAEEAEAQKLNSFISLSNSVSKAQTISSVKTKMIGEANTLESEIALDLSRTLSLPSKFKEDRLSDLNKRILEAELEIGKTLVETNKIKTSAQASNNAANSNQLPNSNSIEGKINNYKEIQSASANDTEKKHSLQTEA